MEMARERKEFPPPKLHTLDDGECAKVSHLTSKMKLGSSNGKRRFRSATKPASVSAMNHCHERVRDKVFHVSSCRVRAAHLRNAPRRKPCRRVRYTAPHRPQLDHRATCIQAQRLWRTRSWPKNGPAKNFANIGRQSPQISHNRSTERRADPVNY